MSKKVSARAVDRNKVERRMRAVLRPVLANLGVSVALVLQAKPSAKDALYAAVERDIETLLGRSGLRGTPRSRISAL